MSYTTVPKRLIKDFVTRKHEKTHNPSVPCPAATTNYPCDFTTAEQRDMQRHLWVTHNRYAIRHNIQDPKDQCNNCKKWFTRRDNLQRHLNEGRCRPGGSTEEEDDD